MTAFSESDTAFVNVQFKHILTLIGLIRESTMTDREYIRRRYSEQALYFEDTVRFLVALGCIKDNGLSLMPDASSIDFGNNESNLAAEVLRRATHPRSPVCPEIHRYIGQFRVAEDRLVYQPHAQQRGVQSHLRNLLMEMDVLRHDAASDVYLLHSGLYDLYSRVATAHSTVTPDAIARSQADRDAIGKAAEIAVVDHERRRVGEQHAKYVEHIALVNAAAGYDIASVTLTVDGTLPRLIEVKAVPAGTLQFYWTENEVAAAERFGPWYFLYLVPTRGMDDFDLDNIRIITDPCRIILDNGNGWAVVPHAYRCKLASELPHGSERSGEAHHE